MIIAVGPNNLIGKGNELVWHSKNDFTHFKKQTNSYPCIFGDVTFYNLPKYPLKNRINIIANLAAKDTELKTNENGFWIETNSLEKAIDLAKGYEKCFICGGKGVYTYCLKNNLIDEIYLTMVNSKELEELVTNDNNNLVYFPIDLFDYTANWDRQDIVYGGYEFVNEEIDCQFIKFTRPIK